MRKWVPVLLIGLTVVWFILTNVGSSQALADITARPILALLKDGQRIPVLQPGQNPAPDAAQLQGGAGVAFGYRFGYLLPGGETVFCTIRFTSLSCDTGWTAEREA